MQKEKEYIDMFKLGMDINIDDEDQVGLVVRGESVLRKELDFT